jgi:hypothetical protein
MPTTFTKIASVSVGAGGAASIDFTSIPSTYTDLCVKMSLRSNETPGASAAGLRINSASTTLTNIYVQGNGASAGSGSVTGTSSNFARLTRQNAQSADSTSNTFSNIELYIPNYAGSNNKSMSVDGVSENNGTTAYAELEAVLWSSSSAINAISVNIYGSTGNSLVQYSTAVLYGIKNS